MSATCATVVTMIIVWLSGSAASMAAAEEVLSIPDEFGALGSLLKEVEASHLRVRVDTAIELAGIARCCELPMLLAGIEKRARSLIVLARRLEGERPPV